MRRSALIVLIAALVMMLSGCQPVRHEEAVKDRFVGVNLIAVQEGQDLEEARTEPHDPDGMYLLIPLELSDDGTPYTKATRSGPYSDTHFTHSDLDGKLGYAMTADLYIGDLLAEPEIKLFLEPVHQRPDGSFYATGPGQIIDMDSIGGVAYGFEEERKVRGNDGKMKTETTSVYVNLLDERLPD